MNQKEINEKYPIYKDYIISGIGCEDGIEKVELQRIDGISGFVEYIDRPLLHPFRYGEVTIFRLKPANESNFNI